VILIVLLGFMLWLYFRASRFVSKQGGLNGSDF
jgi:spermidine/putrescine transport system permease protein